MTMPWRPVGALSHIRVCDFTGQLAGAGATRIMAIFGAQVIRIEDRVNRRALGRAAGRGPLHRRAAGQRAWGPVQQPQRPEAGHHP